MRARFVVAVIAGLTIVTNLLLGVRWGLAVAAAVAVIVVGEVVGRLVQPRLIPNAAPVNGTNPLSDPPQASRAYPLSPRELDVAILIARGLTSKEIGSRLVIKKGTVDKHWEHMKDKLGINSRPQLAIWLMERGLLEPASTMT